MARRWTMKEEKEYKEQLFELYVVHNKTIKETGLILGIAEQTVFQRLQRLHIPSTPSTKENYLRKRKDITFPTQSTLLAEFFGIMLGDGHLSPTQVIVTLGTKEETYTTYVVELIQKLFSASAKIGIRKSGYRDVYLGSTEVATWLRQEGLVSHKVRSQVDVPQWIFERQEYMMAFLRGFFDTDGSIYRLTFGIQISFTNKSTPLLVSLQSMLKKLGYKPSKVGTMRVYLTRVSDVRRFFEEIKPKNQKHVRRFDEFITSVGTQVVNEGRL